MTTKKKKEAKSCRICALNVGAGCEALQQHSADAGPDQPYCDGFFHTEKCVVVDGVQFILVPSPFGFCNGTGPNYNIIRKSKE